MHEGFSGTSWRVMGDFNVVLCPFEKKVYEWGIIDISIESLEFGAFIEVTKLMYFPLLDRKSTLFHSNRVYINRLGHIMLSGGWKDEWG